MRDDRGGICANYSLIWLSRKKKWQKVSRFRLCVIEILLPFCFSLFVSFLDEFFFIKINRVSSVYILYMYKKKQEYVLFVLITIN